MNMYQLVWRVTLLFLVGVCFTIMLDLFQIQYRLPAFERNLLGYSLLSPWWVSAICGTAAAAVGLLYPCLDQKLGENQAIHQEWSSVMKCMALFVGINQASAKIDFSNDTQLSLSLILLSISLWWFCDRTRCGFGLSVLTAVIATLIGHVFVYNGLCRYTEKDLMFVRSWLPCVFFSGGITVGNIGRQLAIDESECSDTKKRHQE